MFITKKHLSLVILPIMWVIYVLTAQYVKILFRQYRISVFPFMQSCKICLMNPNDLIQVID